jgi:serine kinase of HPr protein (carbohydrate metabolism regulator)
MIDRQTIHASTVAIDGRGVMILGASGKGKSDLALRLIDRGAMLVSDDYTQIDRQGDALVASAPATIAGRIEIRGLGIASSPHVDDIAVALAVRLLPGAVATIGRMPGRLLEEFAGVPVPVLFVDPWPASAPLLIEHALRQDLP